MVESHRHVPVAGAGKQEQRLLFSLIGNRFFCLSSKGPRPNLANDTRRLRNS